MGGISRNAGVGKFIRDYYDWLIKKGLTPTLNSIAPLI
jgi:hypothetical protein